MVVTVGILKSILNEIADDVILAHLEYGNDRFHAYVNVKRLLLLKDLDGQKYLTINGQGSHFTGEGEQFHLKYDGHSWDQDSVFKISSNPPVNGTFCTCDPRPKEVFIYSDGEETLFAFCEICKKRVQNLH